MLHRQRTGPNVSVTGPPDPSRVDRVMQLQQSHPPILVGAGSRWMLWDRRAGGRHRLPPAQGAARGTISGELQSDHPSAWSARSSGSNWRLSTWRGRMTWSQLPARTDSQCANRTGKSLANGAQSGSEVALCLVELRGFEPLTPCMPSRDPRHSAHHKALRSRALHQSRTADAWWFMWVRRAELLRDCCAQGVALGAVETNSGWVQ